MAKKATSPLPALGAGAVRTFLKQSGELPLWDEKLLRESLDLAPAQAVSVLAAMQMSGYIEPAPGKKWRNTKEGSAMAGVSAARPIKRSTAEAKLAELRDRIAEVNRNPHYLLSVDRAVLFGSYLRDEPMVKDLDVAILLKPKEKKKEKHERLMHERAAEEVKKGRRFASWQEQERWGAQEILNFLKSRARAITLYEFADWVTKQPHRDL